MYVCAAAAVDTAYVHAAHNVIDEFALGNSEKAGKKMLLAQLSIDVLLICF